MNQKPAVLPVITHMVSVYKTWYGYRDTMPKKSRYTLGDKIDAAFIETAQLLYKAGYQAISDKIPTLDRTISTLDTLKFLLQVSWELKTIDTKKYEILSAGLYEGGRQVGSWRKGLQTKTSTA